MFFEIFRGYRNRKLRRYGLTKNKQWARDNQRKEGNSADIYLFKVNNRNTRKRCEVCSKLTVKQQHYFLL